MARDDLGKQRLFDQHSCPLCELISFRSISRGECENGSDLLLADFGARELGFVPLGIREAGHMSDILSTKIHEIAAHLGEDTRLIPHELRELVPKELLKEAEKIGQAPELIAPDRALPLPLPRGPRQCQAEVKSTSGAPKALWARQSLDQPLWLPQTWGQPPRLLQAWRE